MSKTEDIGEIETEAGSIEITEHVDIKGGMFQFSSEHGITAWGDSLRIKEWSTVPGCGDTDDLMLFEDGDMAISVGIDPSVTDTLVRLSEEYELPVELK